MKRYTANDNIPETSRSIGGGIDGGYLRSGAQGHSASTFGFLETAWLVEAVVGLAIVFWSANKARRSRGK